MEEAGFINKEQIGDCDTIFLFFYGFGNLILGKKGDEMDLRKFLRLGLFFIILTNISLLILGFTQFKNPFLFYICFMINGLA